MRNSKLFKNSALAFAVTVGAFMTAAAQAEQPNTATCKSCQSADQLAKDIAKLNFKLDADKDKGGLKALEAVEKLENFQKIPSSDPQRKELFTSLVRLSREAAPYDGESQLAQILATVSLQDADLKKTLDLDLTKMPKTAGSVAKCKTDLFASRLKESTCLKKAKVIGQQPLGQKQVAEANACTETFNYQKCLDTAK